MSASLRMRVVKGLRVGYHNFMDTMKGQAVFEEGVGEVYEDI